MFPYDGFELLIELCLCSPLLDAWCGALRCERWLLAEWRLDRVITKRVSSRE